VSPFDFSVIVPKMRSAIEEYIAKEKSKGEVLTLRDAVVKWMGNYYEDWFQAHVGIPLLEVQKDLISESKVVRTDRRKNKRIPVEISAYYRVLWTPQGKRNDKVGTILGDIKNISAGGLYIVTGRPYPISTLFEIQFELPGINNPISAFAMVVWRQERSFGRFGHGLHFSHIETQDTNYLDEAILEKLMDAPVICVEKSGE